MQDLSSLSLSLSLNTFLSFCPNFFSLFFSYFFFWLFCSHWVETSEERQEMGRARGVESKPVPLW